MTTLSSPLDPRHLGLEAEAAPGPFTRDRATLLVAGNGIGVAAMVTGWWTASGLSDAGAQLVWLNVTLLGVIVAGAANGLWLAQGRRSVRLAQAALLQQHRAMHAEAKSAPPGLHTASNSDGSAQEFVVIVGAKRFHLPTCNLVRDKDAEVGSRAALERKGHIPCEVCRP